jgi:hypothetical protein
MGGLQTCDPNNETNTAADVWRLQVDVRAEYGLILLTTDILF